MSKVYLSLGSNLGDREDALCRALTLLAAAVSVQAVSALYETDPVGYAAQGPFLNAVVRGETGLAPGDLLAKAKEIEQQVGRTPTVRWGPRVVDVDILMYGEARVREEGLEIPHPRLAERRFVLTPLREIAGDLVHPVTMERIADLEAKARQTSEVRLWKERDKCTK